jgi:iron-sulfur cluster repair protein YtfE (RIC family)
MPRADRTAIEMLDRCHLQIEHHLTALTGAVGNLARGGSRADLSTIHQVRDYFDRSAARHVADEEQSLFPRLPALPVIADLRAQHREHEPLHARLAELTDRLTLPCPAPLAGELADLTRALARAYGEHIELEERELMPAVRALDPALLETVRSEMQARRQRGKRRGGGAKKRAK